MYNENLHQRVQVCRALLSRIGYAHLWTSDGPTPEAKNYLDQYGGPMSNSQWTVYQVAWYVWGRPADVKLQEVMQLPAPLNEWIIALLGALFKGPKAVESWLAGFDRMNDAVRAGAARIHHLS